MKSLDESLICGHASRQQPHVMQRDSGYASSWLSCDWRGPGPSSCDPSSWIQALTRLRSSNMRERSTTRSRTTRELRHRLRASIVCAARGRAVDHRGARLPHAAVDRASCTSRTPPRGTRTPTTTGVVFSPLAVTGCFWISMSALMTFICGCQATSNSCQSPRLARRRPGGLTFRRDLPVARHQAFSVCAGAGFCEGGPRSGGDRAGGARRLVLARARPHEAHVDRVGHVDALRRASV